MSSIKFPDVDDTETEFVPKDSLPQLLKLFYPYLHNQWFQNNTGRIAPLARFAFCIYDDITKELPHTWYPTNGAFLDWFIDNADSLIEQKSHQTMTDFRDSLESQIYALLIACGHPKELLTKPKTQAEKLNEAIEDSLTRWDALEAYVADGGDPENFEW